MSSIRIVDYRPEHQPCFESLNREWIEAMFEMEPMDEWVLKNPGEAILESGGAIIMAEYDGVPAGTVALRKLDDTSFEFSKMAVDKNYRRLGIAEAICYASFRKAASLGAKTIILYSNRRNEGAIQLYEKTGFRHVELGPQIYKRANVKMVIDIESAMRIAQEQEKLINA